MDVAYVPSVTVSWLPWLIAVATAWVATIMVAVLAGQGSEPDDDPATKQARPQTGPELPRQRTRAPTGR